MKYYDGLVTRISCGRVRQLVVLKDFRFAWFRGTATQHRFFYGSVVEAVPRGTSYLDTRTRGSDVHGIILFYWICILLLVHFASEHLHRTLGLPTKLIYALGFGFGNSCPTILFCWWSLRIVSVFGRQHDRRQQPLRSSSICSGCIRCRDKLTGCRGYYVIFLKSRVEVRGETEKGRAFYWCFDIGCCF